MWGWWCAGHDPVVDTDNRIALRLELEAGSSPVRGSLGRAGDEPVEFSGMLQLMALVERLHAHDPTNPTDRPDPRNPS